MLHSNEQKPEKSLDQFNLEAMTNSLMINTMPAAYIAQGLTTHMPRNHPLKMITFSARVSSISDNKLGGWYSYRMSKCALNMLVKNITIEWNRSHPKAHIFGYHPGTVDSALSKPYQSNVKPEKLFSSDIAADHFIEVLSKLTEKQEGLLLDWQGKVIDF